MQLIVLVSALIWYKMDNRRRESRDVDQELAGLSQKEIDDLDWKQPEFRWNP